MIALEGVLDWLGVEYDPSRENNQKVLCPFHDDTVASASVNLSKGLFNCYGCDVAGDAISLVMQKEGLEFRDAKQFAERVAGGARRAVSREPESRDGLLPRRKGHRSGSRAWRSPWGSRES